MTTVLYQSTDGAPIIPNSENVLCNLDNKICFEQNMVEGFQEETVNSYFDTQSVDPTNGDESYIIGNYYKFNETHRLKQVDIVGTDIQIQDNAFKNCRNLEQINITGNLSYIGDSAFMNDESLISSIVFPEQEVFADTCYNCRNLTSVDLSNVIYNIGDRAFKFCSNLRTINIPSGVTSIGNDAFMYCGYNYTNLQNVGVTINIPNTITSIGDNAFKGIPLKEFIFPTGIKLLTTSRFMLAHTFLEEIILPEGLQTLQTSTFEACYNLRKVTIPSSVTEIKSYVFANCTSLTQIIFNGTKAQWSAITKEQGWRSGGWKSSPALIVTCTDGTTSYSAINVTEVSRKTNVLYINTYGYATICVPYPLFYIPTGLSLYRITDISDNTVILSSKVTSTVKNTPYLVKGNPGYYLLTGKFESTGTPLQSGKLIGTFTEIVCPENGYILDYTNNTVKFTLGNERLLSPNTAYLVK